MMHMLSRWKARTQILFALVGMQHRFRSNLNKSGVRCFPNAGLLSDLRFARGRWSPTCNQSNTATLILCITRNREIHVIRSHS